MVVDHIIASLWCFGGGTPQSTTTKIPFYFLLQPKVAVANDASQRKMKLCTTTVGCGALVHLRWYTWDAPHMQHITTTEGCGDTSIANLLHWRSQCSTVRCLHLTVNLQWKLLIFTPKRSFGVKTCEIQPSAGFHSLCCTTTEGCGAVYQLFFLKRKVGQKKSTRISGRKPWDAFMHFGPYGPKCKKARPYGLAVKSKKYTTNHLNRRLRW